MNPESIPNPEKRALPCKTGKNKNLQFASLTLELGYKVGNFKKKRKAMARILIVDDSPTQVNVISRVLAKHGHEVITAEDGEIGVEKAVSEKPDVILMDVVMPNLNGFQATRQITKNPQTSHIPVIMLTSKDQETDRVWAERQGASDYLTKPPNESDLLVKIKAFAQG